MRKLLLSSLLVLALCPAGGFAAGASTAERPAAQAKTHLRFTKHALARMQGRGVTEEQVRKIVATEAPFQYFHQGRWKTGYYEPKTSVFVATNEGVIITVITGATPKYIGDLKRKRP
ncbi:MAG: DUF4258 domain-containing protein [Elusimicrobia bacterium]|nr:DUF4258 domain-containing protein [Elusimicrobiota bacterium]